MKITVLGCGRWGTFLAWYANTLGYSTTMYGRSGSHSLQLLLDNHANEYATLDRGITITDDIDMALQDVDIVLVAVPSQSLREFFASIAHKIVKCKYIVLCMKGLEQTSGKRLSEVAIECGIDSNKLAVWVGPGHIQDFTSGKPNCMVVDSSNADTKTHLATVLKSALVRFYIGHDLIGTEIGAATKNIIGIVAGLLDGHGLTSLKGALMSRGAREVSRLIQACGGSAMSAYGLCHLGDYETTLFSPHSNNLRFGQQYAKGHKFDKLAEGVYTAYAVALRAKELEVDMPITRALVDVMDNVTTFDSVLQELFDRDTKTEFV